MIGKIDGEELLNIPNPQPQNYENMKLNGKLGHRPVGEIWNIILSGIMYILYSFRERIKLSRFFNSNIMYLTCPEFQDMIKV